LLFWLTLSTGLKNFAILLHHILPDRRKTQSNPVET
jgi:hypothetical protein